MTLTPCVLLMCGLGINITLFPDSYSLTLLPKHHSSFPTSVFQFRVCHHFGLWLYHLLQATLERGTMVPPCRGDHGAFSVHVACGPGCTSQSHTSFLGQKRLCVHATANCSARTESRYLWWQVRGPGIALCPALVILNDFSLVAKEGSSPDCCITKTASC